MWISMREHNPHLHPSAWKNAAIYLEGERVLAPVMADDEEGLVLVGRGDADEYWIDALHGRVDIVLPDWCYLVKAS